MNDSKSIRVFIEKQQHPQIVWGQVSDMLDAALTKCGSMMGIDDVYRSILLKRYGLWLITLDDRVVAAYITEIVDMANGRVLNIIALGGSKMEWWVESFDEAVTSYAKANSCALIFEMGRPGWIRVLGKYGWIDGPATAIKKVS